MTSRWLWLLAQLTRRIWVRITLFSLLAVVAALLGITLSPYIPADLPTRIGADAVGNILSIIASSMLTVTTFSLSVMVSAFSAATSNVTPRATKLVMEDRTTHNVLSTFVGSFLFSLVGIIVLSTGAYGAQGRVVLFAATLLVIALIVIALLGWIDHLSRLGRVTETTERVEEAATKAMRERKENPYLGGSPLASFDDIPPEATAVYATKIGYVQHVDIGALSKLTEGTGALVFLRAIPGQFVEPTVPVAYFVGELDGEPEDRVLNCISISDTRSFDQDPRFGASVLAEIASRALSPGINDPGTAIDVIGRSVRLLAIWAEPTEPREPDYPNVFVPPVRVDDLFDDLFTPVARDGAGLIEVMLRLQKGLAALARLDEAQFGHVARRHSQSALLKAEPELSVEEFHSLAAAADAVSVTGR